ncbi:hypothetical protein A2V71_03365 [Candidatus Berkelbacteria bacterium RBG_13_40_8]|uniref:AB hydrolase-1 domain-containing protein n=1 Tax=Candidatus Berkelbacteria bacterium RBG_13_40_8 TaxID=1797467 RepID=A0A1F5DQX4_9BACT|nr:MAG: hypothetical protein A2V71_03365 [Candidatus Berkelbacteria bacterium RBG_13_40_8]
MIERVVIVHGHASDPARYWFESLKRYLISLDCTEVLIPKMPHPNLPSIRLWKKKLFSVLDDRFEQAVIIGHSFGGISAFRLAEVLPADRKLGAIIAVASPVKRVWNPLFPARILFREPKWKLVRLKTKKISLIYSTDDWICPHSNALYLQSKLSCELLSLDNYHHICCSHLPNQAKIFIAQTIGLSKPSE